MSRCCGDTIGSSAELEQWWWWGGGPDRLLTPLHFQDTKMQRAAQAERMEVQKRGNHGTLSAQLHNEKSNPLVVSILHVMFRAPVAQPLASIRPAQPPHMQDSQPGTVCLKERLRQNSS